MCYKMNILQLISFYNISDICVARTKVVEWIPSFLWEFTCQRSGQNVSSAVVAHSKTILSISSNLILEIVAQ